MGDLLEEASASTRLRRGEVVEGVVVQVGRDEILVDVGSKAEAIIPAAEAGVPVCPHAGGVGLCELVQHLSVLDYVCVSGSLDGRMIEYVDHLHEHFVDPVVIRSGSYVLPARPGFSAEMHGESLARYRFPDGAEWAGEAAAGAAGAPVRR